MTFEGNVMIKTVEGRNWYKRDEVSVKRVPVI